MSLNVVGAQAAYSRMKRALENPHKDMSHIFWISTTLCMYAHNILDDALDYLQRTRMNASNEEQQAAIDAANIIAHLSWEIKPSGITKSCS